MSYKELKKFAGIMNEVQTLFLNPTDWTVSRIQKCFSRAEKSNRMRNGSMNMVNAVRDAIDKAEKKRKELKEKKND